MSLDTSTKNALIAAGIGAAAGYAIGYNMAPSVAERKRYGACGAIAGAAIGVLIITIAQKNNLANHCYNNFDINKCITETIKTVKQVAPEAIKVGVACGSGQIVPCILSALPEK